MDNIDWSSPPFKRRRIGTVQRDHQVSEITGYYSTGPGASYDPASYHSHVKFVRPTSTTTMPYNDANGSLQQAVATRTQGYQQRQGADLFEVITSGCEFTSSVIPDAAFSGQGRYANTSDPSCTSRFFTTPGQSGLFHQMQPGNSAPNASSCEVSGSSHEDTNPTPGFTYTANVHEHTPFTDVGLSNVYSTQKMSMEYMMNECDQVPSGASAYSSLLYRSPPIDCTSQAIQQMASTDTNAEDEIVCFGLVSVNLRSVYMALL